MSFFPILTHIRALNMDFNLHLSTAFQRYLFNYQLNERVE